MNKELLVALGGMLCFVVFGAIFVGVLWNVVTYVRKRRWNKDYLVRVEAAERMRWEMERAASAFHESGDASLAFMAVRDSINEYAGAINLERAVDLWRRRTDRDAVDRFLRETTLGDES